MAIAIFAFSIVIIVGLLDVSLNADRQAAADTELALMTETMISILNQQVQSLGFATFKTRYTAQPLVLYFNYQAQPALNASNQPDFGNQHSDSVYACTAQCSAAPTVYQPSGTTPTTNVLYAQLNFTWPVTVTPPPNKRIVNTTIVNKD